MRLITDKGQIEFINLTPHDINLIRGNNTVLTLSRAINPPRVEERVESQEHLTVNGSYDIPIYQARNEYVAKLPEKREGYYYIVSRIIAEYSERDDLLVPHGLVRDSNGNIIGCSSFKKVN
jgi:hypothetical protein